MCIAERCWATASSNNDIHTSDKIECIPFYEKESIRCENIINNDDTFNHYSLMLRIILDGDFFEIKGDNHT